jgi:regulator of replication initiation timing
MRFLERLENLVEECIALNLGNWIQNGTIFHIYDIKDFEKNIKPAYSLNTLKRQLNYYDFTLSFSNGLTFQHPNFTKYKKEDIQRNVKKRAIDNKQRREQRKKIKLCNLSLLPPPSPMTQELSSLDERIERISKQLNNITKQISEIIRMREEKNLEAEKIMVNEYLSGYYSVPVSRTVSTNVSRCSSPISFEEMSKLIENSEFRIIDVNQYL